MNKVESDLKIDDVPDDHLDSESKRELNNISGKSGNNEGGEDSEKDNVKEGDKAEDLLDDPLDRVPPDFDKAKKYQDATKVKNIAEDAHEKGEGAMFDEAEDFCEFSHLPTSKAAPLFKLCTNTFNLEDLGSGFPLYYEFKKFIFVVFLVMI